MSTINPACARIDEAIEAFGIGSAINGRLLQKDPYGNGHINDTFRLRYETPDHSEKNYILQRMNHDIFRNPPLLMENIVNVTEHLRGIILSRGGDADRETLNVLKTRDGASFFRDTDNNYWRGFPFIERSICLEKVGSAKDFYDSAVAFGNFQKMLADYPATTLHETIPNFHNTPSRFRDFQQAVQNGDRERAALAEKEIAFALDRASETAVLTDLLDRGELPLRVTHNDTKLNNVLFDGETMRSLAVVDLDTVMPGLSVNDFGDSIRFGATYAAEDETDLEKVQFELSLFECYTRGFLGECGALLTENEKKMLPVGAIMMTFECGMRFLTDYLNGDTYFKIHRENHNLDRCRTQFKLVRDMEAAREQMDEAVRRYS